MKVSCFIDNNNNNTATTNLFPIATSNKPCNFSLQIRKLQKNHKKYYLTKGRSLTYLLSVVETLLFSSFSKQIDKEHSQSSVQLVLARSANTKRPFPSQCSLLQFHYRCTRARCQLLYNFFITNSEQIIA